MTAPYFFLSYAPVQPPGDPGEHSDHANPGGADRPAADKHVREFYYDLSEQVVRMAGTGTLSPGGAGHLADDRGRHRTAHALYAARGFVPLISRRYFTDPSCGRQWYAFTHREPPGALIPVLWAPVPTTARPVVVDLALPAPKGPATPVRVGARAIERYAADGLYGLRRDPELREDYAQCVRRIAQCVVSAASGVADPAPGFRAPPDLDELPDAFAASSWHPLGIAVLAPDLDHLPPDRRDTKYGPEPRDWQPFSDGYGTSLAERTAELARNLGFAPEIRTYDDAEPVFLGARETRSPWVLILDPWILHDPRAMDRLRAFDARDLPWVTVLTPLADDAQTRAAHRELRALLHTALPRRLSRGRAIQRAAVEGIPHSEAFNSRFMELADSAAQHYLNRVPLRSSTRSAGQLVLRSRPARLARDRTDPPGDTHPPGDQEAPS
ncbi:FxsC protein [Streptomyces sp. NPDC056716]|uniref:FxsC protein n=1 Tax=unclassified Streptomyces TaxID=2593676 RepID=UPI00367AD5E1